MKTINERINDKLDRINENVIKIKQRLNLYENTLKLISELPDVRIDEARVIARETLNAD